MKKGIIAVLAAAGIIAACGAYAAATIPVRLEIGTVKEKIYRCEPIGKDDITVAAVTFAGTRKEITDFACQTDTGGDRCIVSVQSGRLSGSAAFDMISGSVRAEYGENVHEGDRFTAESMDVRYVYSDGKTVRPESVTYEAPDVFTGDTKIVVHTEYGDAEVQVWVSSVSGITAVYDKTVHEGDLFDNEALKVSVSFADGASISDVPFVCTNAPFYFTDGIVLVASTSYGNGTAAVNPVKIRSVSMVGGKRLHSGDKFPGGDMSLIYEDGTEYTVPQDEITYHMDMDTPLEEGVLEISFSWHGKKYRTNTEVFPSNKATKAADRSTELADAVASVTEDTIYAAVTKTDSYYLTHIITMDAASQTKAEFASGIGYGYSESAGDAAVRTGWAVGVNASNPSSLPSVIIRDGQLQQDGLTNGSEICLTIDGIFFSPEPEKNGEELLAMGVKDIWWTDAPTLIQTGSEPEGLGEEKRNRTIIAMKGPGEYYILTTVGEGLTYAESRKLLLDLGAKYARAFGGEENEALFVGSRSILGNDPMEPDFLYFSK